MHANTHALHRMAFVLNECIAHELREAYLEAKPPFELAVAHELYHKIDQLGDSIHKLIHELDDRLEQGEMTEAILQSLGLSPE